MDNTTDVKLKKCGNCMAVYYCSTSCQKEDWTSHKEVCNKVLKEELKEEQPECPICFEVIHETVNRTITECGHCFHSSCLIKHTVLTNMGCPLCRYVLADIPDSESEFDSDMESESEPEIVNELEQEEQEQEQEVVEKRTVDELLTEMKNRNITEKHLVSTLLSLIYEQSSMDRLFILDERDSDMECEVFDVLG